MIDFADIPNDDSAFICTFSPKWALLCFYLRRRWYFLLLMMLQWWWYVIEGRVKELVDDASLAMVVLWFFYFIYINRTWSILFIYNLYHFVRFYLVNNAFSLLLYFDHDVLFFVRILLISQKTGFTSFHLIRIWNNDFRRLFNRNCYFWKYLLHGNDYRSIDSLLWLWSTNKSSFDDTLDYFSKLLLYIANLRLK